MAKLTSKQRNAMSSSTFAGPDRSYPINDPNHARNALSRVAQHGSPALQAKVRAKVHAKYPGIGKSDGGKGAQPVFKGAAKAAHRAQEHAYDEKMHSSTAPGGDLQGSFHAAHDPNSRGNAGDMRSGMERAMSDHADKLHPVRQSRLADKSKPAPRMMSY